MRREFKVVGKIDEDTKVLGTTYGQVREVIEAGFKEQFRMIGRGKAVEAVDAVAKAAEELNMQYKSLAEKHAAFRAKTSKHKAALRNQLSVLRGGTLSGNTANTSKLYPLHFNIVGVGAGGGKIVNLVKRVLAGVDKVPVPVTNELSVKNYEPLGTKGVVAGMLVPKGKFEASLSGEHLVLKTTAKDEPAKTVYRRRAEDKDLTR